MRKNLRTAFRLKSTDSYKQQTWNEILSLLKPETSKQLINLAKVGLFNLCNLGVLITCKHRVNFMLSSKQLEFCQVHSVEDSATTLFNEPLFGIFSCHALEFTNDTVSLSSLSNSATSTGKDNIEVHTENTGWGVILDSEIDVFFDTKAEVAYYNY